MIKYSIGIYAFFKYKGEAMKRLTALFLAVAMVVAVATFTVAPTVSADWDYGGDGTPSNPYKVTYASFPAFIENLESYDQSFANSNFKFEFDLKFDDSNNNGKKNYRFVYLESGKVAVYIGEDSVSTTCYVGTGIKDTTIGAFYAADTASTPSGTAPSLTSTCSGVPYSRFFYAIKNVTGIIDFNGHCVSGIYRNVSDSAEKGVGGLFDEFIGTVKNVVVENSLIVSKGKQNVGGIAGYATDNAQFINCVSEAIVCSNYPNVGGIVGLADRNTVKAYEGNHVQIVDCVNKGVVYGQYDEYDESNTQNADAGGIVGQARAAEIIRCINTGDISSNGGYNGGIVGLADTCGLGNKNIGTLKVIDCVNAGKVSTTADATYSRRTAGIVGYFDLHWSYPEGTDAIIRGCVNTGVVDCSNTKEYGSILGLCNMPNTTIDSEKNPTPRKAYIEVSDNTYTGKLGSIDFVNGVSYSGGNKDAGTVDSAKMATAIIDLAEKYQKDRPSSSASYSYLLPNKEIVANLDGVGTKSNPISVTKASDFSNIQKGHYYKVENDITLSAALAANYGNITAADGVKITLLTSANAITNNFGTISNIEFIGNNSNSAVANNYGEISHCKTSGTFANAALVNVNNINATVEYCENRAIVSASENYAGGVVCENNGTVYACSNYGAVSAATAGGIVGKTVISVETQVKTFETISDAKIFTVTGGTVTACANYADITGTNTAGIVGEAAYTGSVTGNFTHTDYKYITTKNSNYVNIKDASFGQFPEIEGAISTESLKGVIGKCYNNGNAKSGIVGVIFENGDYIIDQCVNTGSCTYAFSQPTQMSTENENSSLSSSDAASGKVCVLLNGFIESDVFGQEIGTDEYPTVGGKKVVECAPSRIGTYTTPARGTFVSNEGSFAGFSAGGHSYTYNSTVNYPCVNVEYANGFITENGASVKVTSKEETGLRWTAVLPENTFENEVVSKGFIIVPTSYITGDYAVVNNKKVKSKSTALDFTIEALKEKGLNYIDVEVDGFSENNEFMASVVNLLPSHYGLSYSARAYVKLKYSDGKYGYVYSGWEDGYVSYSTENARTPGQVAAMALADKTANYINSVRDVLSAYITEEPANPEKTEQDFTYPVYNDSAKYTEMKKKLRDFIYNELKTGDKTLFSFESLQTLNSYGTGVLQTVPFATIVGNSNWMTSLTSTKENGNEVITAIYNCSGLQFTTTVTLYSDNPSADIITWVKNTAQTVSPVINGLTGLTASYKLTDGGDITLHTLEGSKAHADDFALVEEKLTQTVSTYANDQTHAGLSSSWAWPYFDFIGDNKGLLMAIGWSGQWQGQFSKDTNGNVNINAKQKDFNMFLKPGETVRTPSIVLTYFDGDYEYGHNVFRELVLKHYTPDDDNDASNGTNFKAPISLNFWGGNYDKTIAKNIKAYSEYGTKADIVWFDTGWNSSKTYVQNRNDGGLTSFTSRKELEDAIEAKLCDNDVDNSDLANKTFNQSPVWEALIGSYSINSTLFENGSFKIVTDAITEANKKTGINYKFMVWWMIENHRNSNSVYECPEYSQVGDAVLDATHYNSAGQLRLEDDDVLTAVLNYYETIFDQEDVQAVRLDSCMSPISSWRANDQALTKKIYASTTQNYRLGYSENKYIQNFYTLWDTLKSEYPDFFLDNCASGGRRLDIEMTKRSMPLWRTDYSSAHYDAMQYETQNLSLWLPLTAIGVASPGDKYQNRSFYSASTCVGGKNATNNSNLPLVDAIVDEYVDLRDYWYGNYYQLLEAKNDRVSWQSYELYREDLGEGMIVGIVREYTDETENAYGGISRSKTVKARGLVSCATYRVHNIDDINGSTDRYMTGAELMNNGITFDSATKTVSCYKLTLVD